MANTLLEAIEKSQNKTLTKEGSGIFNTPNETGQVNTLVRTGQTGKALPTGSGPRASNIGEKAAQVETQQGLQQAQTDTSTQQMQTEQAEEVQRRAATIQNANLEEKRQSMTDQFNRQSKALLDQYARDSQELDLQKDKARTEQLGTMLRLSDDKYIKNLQAEGQRARLLTDVGMKEAIQREVFSDELDLLNGDLEFKALMGDKKRDLTKELANIDLASAIQLANSQNQAANQRMLWEGVGGLVSSGAQYLGSRPEEQKGAEDVPEYTQDLGDGGQMNA